MKNKYIVTTIIITLILGISVVSAFWPFSKGSDLTGKVVDEIAFNNSDSCTDSDNGVYSKIPGVVKKIRSSLIFSNTYHRADVCSKNKVIEYYCDKGKIKRTTIRCIAGCENENLTIDGEEFIVGYCISPEPSCTEIKPGIVRDETGKIYKSGCGKGEEKNIYIRYSCEGNEVREVREDCSELGEFGKCTSIGCVGACNDTDPENNKDIPGIVIADGSSYPDKCVRDDEAVKQYKCVKGRVVSLNSVRCGVDRVCVVDETTGAGHCKNKEEANETITLEGLKRIVQNLQDRVEALEEIIEELVNQQ